MEGISFLRRFVDGHLTSPLILIGPEGVGKRISVLKAVQEAFCNGTREQNCPCSSCYTITRNNHPDVVVLTADEKDISVDAIRGLISEAKSYPASARMRCFIIDGADHFTVPAANAFLKTLEEPPACSKFFLLAENANRVLPTILSRCGRVRYKTLPETFILSIIQQYEKDSVKALVYSRLGEGSAGNAVHYWGSGKLALRDQVLKALMLALDKDTPALFSIIDSVEQDLALFLKFLGQVIHDFLVVRIASAKVINMDCFDNIKKLESKRSIREWAHLAKRIKNLQNLYSISRINLSFHIKTIFIDSFR